MEPHELLNYENWVVIGNVLDSSKFAYKILKSLEQGNFNVKGIYPKDTTGTAFKSLKEVPYKIDVIDLCINPALGINFIKEAKELGIDKVLVQPGAESQEILDYCKENGITAIESCALVLLSIYRNIKTHHA
ncbi:CoA-binding protein [Clostridium bovifaecis]|uniref:CoA-binding protein n=1 Tax=Clostridium bovifaecis TaxID=2184719 RepID=A0A6I6F2A2_9CLOT|nr:CoA-binding protein [Clostridium bovifaecis]